MYLLYDYAGYLHLKPAVGPNVVSEAGEPASPRADAAQRRIMLCGAENQSLSIMA